MEYRSLGLSKTVIQIEIAIFIAANTQQQSINYMLAAAISSNSCSVSPALAKVEITKSVFLAQYSSMVNPSLSVKVIFNFEYWANNSLSFFSVSRKRR
jgi:hypothetical protein